MRARLEIRVLYDAPAQKCGRVLRVLPLPRPSLEPSHERFTFFPPPDSHTVDLDPWNNRRLHVFHRHIEREFRLSLEAQVHPLATPVPLGGPIGMLKMPSRATPFAPQLLEIAREARSQQPLPRAHLLNRHVFESLQYTTQTSERPAGAGQIWQEGRGSCADFAHVLLALCRASGLAARYVAGFGPAPGALHAWVEVAVDGAWLGFDPTHGREAVGLYLPVATGRDFYDCAPHRGRFHGQGAQLQLRCELQPECEHEAPLKNLSE